MMGKRASSENGGYTANSTTNCCPCPPCPLLFSTAYKILPSAFNTDTTTERYNFPTHATDLDQDEPLPSPRPRQHRRPQ